MDASIFSQLVQTLCIMMVKSAKTQQMVRWEKMMRMKSMTRMVTMILHWTRLPPFHTPYSPGGTCHSCQTPPTAVYSIPSRLICIFLLCQVCVLSQLFKLSLHLVYTSLVPRINSFKMLMATCVHSLTTCM